MMNIAASLSTLTQDMKNEVIQANLYLYCKDITGHEEAKGCYIGSFETLMTIMKENIFHPHLFDLNLMFDSNFTGNMTAMSFGYTNAIKQLEPMFPIVRLEDDLKEDFVVNGNAAPFIPFCQLDNVWSKWDHWGSYLVEKEDQEEFEFLSIGMDEKLDGNGAAAYKFENLNSFHEFCTLFRPSFTDKGICYTFNGVDSADMFVDSDYIDAYRKVFGLPPEAYPEEKFIASGLGIRNGLRLILDAHTLTSRYKIIPKTDATFQMSLQYPKDFPLPLMEGIQIRAGYKTRQVQQ